MPRICLRFIFPLRKSTPINAAQTASERASERASDDETPAISTIEYTGGGGGENLTYYSNELRQPSYSCPSVAVWAAGHSHTVCVHMVWLRVLCERVWRRGVHAPVLRLMTALPKPGLGANCSVRSIQISQRVRQSPSSSMRYHGTRPGLQLQCPNTPPFKKPPSCLSRACLGK